jgi:hypothetical protein
VGALASAGALVVSSSALALDPPPGGGYPNDVTALGTDALFNVTGDALPGDDTAIGFEALYSSGVPTDGRNTAVGSQAMHQTTTAAGNVGVGCDALYQTTTGFWNVGVGDSAAGANTTGSGNVAVGEEALLVNQTGFGNVAIGYAAGFSITGGDNIAIGDRAMANLNGAGRENVAVGESALSYCGGSRNIAIGTVAGLQITTGSHNIDIGNQGQSDDARTIRIGNYETQRAAYMAGIAGVPVPLGLEVIVDRFGHLGTVAHAARFEEQVRPMGKGSEAILSLQPVTFRYGKELDSLGTAQFGLVAEEVAKVAPDLVARDAEGKPFSVRYDAVNAMLLNEFLKEHRKVEEQAGEIGALKSALAEVQQALAKQAAQIEKVSAAVTGAVGTRVAETNAGATGAR